jgi:hypothetical protein
MKLFIPWNECFLHFIINNEIIFPKTFIIEQAFIAYFIFKFAPYAVFLAGSLTVNFEGRACILTN